MLYFLRPQYYKDVASQPWTSLAWWNASFMHERYFSFFTGVSWETAQKEWVWKGGDSFKSERWLVEPSVCTSQSHPDIQKPPFGAVFNSTLAKVSLEWREKKAFAAVLCSFCHEVQHSFNKTAIIVAAAAAAIVALTYWDCHSEPPLGADACISSKRKKVHRSRLVFGKAVHMILVLPLLFILSSFVGYLPSFSIPSVNSLLFSPFVPPSKR